MDKTTILAVGGDARQIYMCEKLAESFRVYAYRTSAAPGGAVMTAEPGAAMPKPDVLVLPLPTKSEPGGEGCLIPLPDGSRVGLRALLGTLAPGGLVIGGKADPGLISETAEAGFEYTDCFARRELVVRNCIPTAEGALMIAMQEQAETVHGSRVLITGFGNVARAAALLFKGAGADVTCAVRRPDAAAEAENVGCRSADIRALAALVPSFDTIINTAPALLFTEDVLRRVGPGSLIIDLASLPGGADKEALRKTGVRYIHALALPGKVAPVTAGRCIAAAVENIISERGVGNVT